MSITQPFTQVARLPASSDNAAIATRRLEAGTQIHYGGQTFTLDFTVLEGHRFAVEPIAAGADLTSWELPFGTAVSPIAPGQYLCNKATLAELNGRSEAFTLPAAANFSDISRRHRLATDQFRAALPLPLNPAPRSFSGYRRPGRRGVGTRNHIILVGTTARTGPFVNQLAARLQAEAATQPNIDTITAVAHTEGDGEHPNNREMLLRTLAGWIVHPNVAAALIVDAGPGGIDNNALRLFMEKRAYPLQEVRHHFFSMRTGFEAGLVAAANLVSNWLAPVNALSRTAVPVSELKIALQCGGSDAFSGISGNPLAGWAARELIRQGGAANLAETDELMGAESYVLQKVRNLETAERFLAVLQRFKEYTYRHGVSPEGNPTGGNRYRGLYNTALKSIGAANKKHPDLPLDFVIDYSQPMTAPGFYFMDSPGNDLESIAGQVAAGCNLIIFVTGNGSITNFPFVPTLKIVTTTARYEHLRQDMDINAGRYLDGTPLPELGREAFDMLLDTASGQASAGEQAGHTQVQIWRDWPLKQKVDLSSFQILSQPAAGKPLAVNMTAVPPFPPINAVQTPFGIAAEQVGLILPTSLCAGQIAQMAARQLNQLPAEKRPGLSRFAALTHTEGCGFSTGAHEFFRRTMLGYLTQPLVGHCLLLEHGCEMTHNDYFRQQLKKAGLSEAAYGWASIQGDGGIQPALQKIHRWFQGRLHQVGLPGRQPADLSQLCVAFLADADLSEPAAVTFTETVQQLLQAGSTVIVPQGANPLAQPAIGGRLLAEASSQPTLAYAQKPEDPGLHLMAVPRSNWSESVTGLGAAGAALLVAFTTDPARPGQPLVPMLRVAEATAGETFSAADIIISPSPKGAENPLTTGIAQTLAGDYNPRVMALGNTNFQLTRGYLGISV